MNLLLVIAIWPDNAAQAEKLVDLIQTMNLRKPIGHALLCFASDVHAEMRSRLKISSSLAFESHAEIEIKPIGDPTLPKQAWINNAFKQAATHISEFYTGAFLWLEPDCVPVKDTWYHDLSKTYANQPRAYMGTQMKAITKDSKEFLFMARVGCYPANAAMKMFTQDGKAAIELLAAHVVGPRMTPTKLIQPLLIHEDADLDKVRSDAVLVHGDKQGKLLQKINNQLTDLDYEPAGETVPVKNGEVDKPRKRRSRLEMLTVKNGTL